jgi:hypothetical protein
MSMTAHAWRLRTSPVKPFLALGQDNDAVPLP